MAEAKATQTFVIHLRPEEANGWRAEVVEIPGVIFSGHSVDEAVRKAKAVIFRMLAAQTERGELPHLRTIVFDVL